MAVRANDTEIAQPIVIPQPVDVIQLKRDWPAVPGIQATHLASCFLEALLDEPPPQVARLSQSPSRQYFLERRSGNGRPMVAEPPALSHELRHVESEILHPLLEARLIATRPQLQLGQHLGQGSRHGCRVDDLLV